MFKRLQIGGWRQFRNIDINFDDQLTIITGANGTGKTTILNLLNQHFGWNIGLVSTPILTRKRASRYFSDYWTNRSFREIQETDRIHEIGRLQYDDGDEAILTVPIEVNHEYRVTLRNQRQVPGIYVSSHRPVYLYQPVESIPTKIDNREQLLNVYLDEMRSRYTLNAHVRSPSHRIKEALITLATFGYGNEVVQRDDEAVQTFEGFQRILRIVLPRSLGFQSFQIRMPEVVLNTDTGEFSLDAVSGGVGALIDVSWQIYMYALSHETFTVIIDEPENHLHPELQRTILPNFLKAFPNVAFVVATHNPFIISSVPSSYVYVLNYDDKRLVVYHA